jgi:hypothetical protein
VQTESLATGGTECRFEVKPFDELRTAHAAGVLGGKEV